VIIPRDAPSLMGTTVDGPCYQVVLYFTASAEALARWKAEGSAASRLFSRWAARVPADTELKERFKLLVKMDNLKELGLSGMLERYNGKPALVTKSGSLHVGDDYIEVGVNTFRFAYLTKKGVQHVLPRIHELKLHCAVTIEGRENDELPEQALAACRLSGFNLIKRAAELAEGGC